MHNMISHIDYTQYPLKRGLQIFGKDGEKAVEKEIEQLDYMDVPDPKHPSELTEQDRRRALRYLMFLKKKRSGKIKACGCADGRSQRSYIRKEDSRGPTVHTESMLISCAIDAKEGRDVATFDLPGFFMQTEQTGTEHVLLDGVMAEMLVKNNPKKYKKYLWYRGRVQMLYFKLKKALYGTLQGAKLAWQKLAAKFQEWGFELNPYDQCVANKTINGTQCTVLWHVDDIKISHKDPAIVTEIIDMLKAEYGKYADLTVVRGKVHDYLGMTLDFRENGKVKISMFKYIEELLLGLNEKMKGIAVTPAALHLFEVNNNSAKLDKEASDEFHTIVAKLLFLSKRARPDILTAVSFLCTRVQNPDADDLKKLQRVIKYLRGTKGLPLTLEIEEENGIKWWVDAAYAVHPDMRSHTGQIMKMGKGAIYSSSGKQKLNTRSSTEAELVGANDAMGQILWTKNFVKAQGYKLTENVLYQDNMSSMLLEKNGQNSSTKRTKHINVRYFFITDQLYKKEVELKYCPTDQMIADYMTKALQGKLFRKFRREIMNMGDDSEIYDLTYHRSVLDVKQEKVTPATNETSQG